MLELKKHHLCHQSPKVGGGVKRKSKKLQRNNNRIFQTWLKMIILKQLYDYLKCYIFYYRMEIWVYRGRNKHE